MAASKKKRVISAELENEVGENSDLEDERDMEEGDSEVEDSEMVNEEVQVEFEARNPEDSDFHGIRKLLSQWFLYRMGWFYAFNFIKFDSDMNTTGKTLFLKANINISELADTIISQNYVGSVIKQVDMPEDDDTEDDDEEMDVFGVVSVINMTEKKNLPSIGEVKSVILEKCQQCAQKHRTQLQTVLDSADDHLGLILNERFINIPAQIALPSFESLWKEMERARKKNMKYSFTNYLLVAKTYRMPSIGGKKHPQNQSQLTFVNAEEELFHQESLLSFEYSVASERDMVCGGGWDDEEEELEPYRTVMIVPADKIPIIMQKMRDTLALPIT